MMLKRTLIFGWQPVSALQLHRGAVWVTTGRPSPGKSAGPACQNCLARIPPLTTVHGVGMMAHPGGDCHIA
jgi:hypothetical protein